METITTNTKTLELTGVEIHIHFTSAFPCFWVRNDSGGIVLISLSPNISEGKDGVIEVPAGSSAGTMHGFNDTRNDLYLLGKGKVQVMGTYTPENPFRKARKGGGENAGSNILPHSEGLAAYFDHSQNVSETGWTDIVSGLIINGDMIKNDDSVTLLSDGTIDLDLSNAFTIYVICKYIGNSDDWWGIVTEDGAIPRFNLASYNYNLGLKTGKSAMDIVKPYSASDYHICTMVFLNGAAILYIDGVYVYYDGNFKTSITNNYALGKQCNFKIAAFYENVAQSSALIADNVNYLAQKYGIGI